MFRAKVQQAQAVITTTLITPTIITLAITNGKERLVMLLPKWPRKGVKSPLLDHVVP